MPEAPNGKLTWWLLGIFATIIILGLSLIISTIMNINSAVTAMEVLGSSNLERVKHIEESVKSIIPDKIEYLTKHSELVNKVANLENSLKLLEGRISAISEKVVVQSTTLDSLSFKDKLEERSRSRENK